MKLEVIEWSSGTVVHTVDVKSLSERAIEMTERGLLRNMDREQFGVRRADEE